MDPGQVNRKLEPLSERGYLIATRSEADSARKRWQLTQSGREICLQLQATLERAVAEEYDALPGRLRSAMMQSAGLDPSEPSTLPRVRTELRHVQLTDFPWILAYAMRFYPGEATWARRCLGALNQQSGQLEGVGKEGWVAVSNRSPVGFALLLLDSDSVAATVFVAIGDGPQRRQKWGRTLMTRALARAKELDLSYVRAFSPLKAPELPRFYKSLGFKLDEKDRIDLRIDPNETVQSFRYTFPLTRRGV